jgi:hypothetical protein
MWREYHPSLPLRDQTNPRSIEQMEESRSQTLNYEPSPRGKPVFISYFPFNLYSVHRAYLNFKFNFTIALISKQDVEKQFWRFLVIRPNLEVWSYLPSTKFLCMIFTGGDTSAWTKYSRVGRTKWYGLTYDFSQIHEDKHYKLPGAQLITKMKTRQPGIQKLALGRPHFQ